MHNEPLQAILVYTTPAEPYSQLRRLLKQLRQKSCTYPEDIFSDIDKTLSDLNTDIGSTGSDVLNRYLIDTKNSGRKWMFFITTTKLISEINFATTINYYSKVSLKRSQPTTLIPISRLATNSFSSQRHCQWINTRSQRKITTKGNLISKIPFTFKTSGIVKAAVIAIIGLGFHSAATANALSQDEITFNTTYVYQAEVAFNKYGKCYRATHDIAPGTIVERFIGREVKYEDVPESEIIYAACHGDGMWTIPMTNARYINHSCNPNCTINGASEVVAVRSIKAGEEITFDYVTISNEEWSKAPNEYFWDPRWSFDCQCGAENCYGRIDRYYIK